MLKNPAIQKDFSCEKLHGFHFQVAKTCNFHSKDGGRLEMEFLVETADGVVPVEVKAKTGATLSLDKLLADPSIPFSYKLTGGNVGVAGKKVTMPHYMAMFLRPAR